MADIRDSFLQYWHAVLKPAIAPQAISLVESLVVIAVLIYAGRLLERAWRGGRLAQRTNLNVGILIGRLTYLACLAVAAFWIAHLLGFQPSGLLTFLGGVSVAVGLAVRDLLSNLIAGLYLLWERPFVVGDGIQVQDVCGRVEDVGMRVTKLRTETNQLVMVPNSVLLSAIVTNRRDEVAGKHGEGAR